MNGKDCRICLHPYHETSCAICGCNRNHWTPPPTMPAVKLAAKDARINQLEIGYDTLRTALKRAEAEVERLRAALEKIVEDAPKSHHVCVRCKDLTSIAREALEKSGASGV